MYVVGSAPSEANALVSAVSWIQNILLGPFATAIAVIAVALIGFMMLTGRLNIRRGAYVILGCFIVFGAPVIVSGFGNAPLLARPSLVFPPDDQAGFSIVSITALSYSNHLTSLVIDDHVVSVAPTFPHHSRGDLRRLLHPATSDQPTDPSSLPRVKA